MQVLPTVITTITMSSFPVISDFNALFYSEENKKCNKKAIQGWYKG